MLLLVWMMINFIILVLAVNISAWLIAKFLNNTETSETIIINHGKSKEVVNGPVVEKPKVIPGRPTTKTQDNDDAWICPSCKKYSSLCGAERIPKDGESCPIFEPESAVKTCPKCQSDMKEIAGAHGKTAKYQCYDCGYYLRTVWGGFGSGGKPDGYINIDNEAT